MVPARSDMNGSRLDVGIEGFWSKVRDAPSAVLLLDYDGTLAPFHVDRMQAIPLEGVIEALREIRDHTETEVALISGRPVREILALMPDPGVTIIGTHGFEIRRPGEDVMTLEVSDLQRDLLDHAQSDAQQIVGDDRTERKAATVAAHFRGLDRLDSERVEQQIRDRWQDYADRSAVEVRQFNGGLEMRALGRHKGVAVAEFLDRCPEGTLAVYIGDDDTDEDAFNVLGDYGGYGIRVGDPSETTAAMGALPACEDVLRFLRVWIRKRRTS